MTDPRVGRLPIYLYGAGGHGRSVFEVIHREGRYEVTAVLDDGLEPGSTFRGVEILGGRELVPVLAETGPREGLVTIGDNEARERIVELLRAAELAFVSAVDPSAQIARDAELGAGSVVMPGVVVTTGVRVGEHAILNTSCSVDHDSEVESFAHLSPGVHVSGGCVIGRAAHLGIGTSVVQGVRVGRHASVGAGAAVLDDVADGSTVVGVPARPLRGGE